MSFVLETAMGASFDKNPYSFENTVYSCHSVISEPPARLSASCRRATRTVDLVTMKDDEDPKVFFSRFNLRPRCGLWVLFKIEEEVCRSLSVNSRTL